MSKKDQAQKLKAQGNQAMLNSQYDRAIQLYARAIELDPHSAVYHNNISLAYFRQENYKQAEEHARRSIELDPKYLKAHIKLVETLMEGERYAEAQTALTDGLAVNDTCSELLELQQRLNHEMQHPLSFREVPGQDRLIRWLSTSTAKFDRLGVAQFGEDYRGVIAKKKINKKDQILFVPRSHMITLELAKKDCPTCQKLLNAKCDLLSPKHTYLSLYLLQQRANPDSYWKDYIVVLPTQYPSFPVFYKEEELAELEGSSFLYMIKERVTDLRKDYETVRTTDPLFDVPFMDFCWARTTVCSRIFGLVIDGVKTDAMVPFADMLNHRVPKHTSWNYSQQLEGFIIESVQDIEKGEEVFDSYGKKCNSRFLLNYGFVMEDNEANQVSYRACFRQQDVLLDQKRELIADKAFVRFFKVAKQWHEGGFQELLGFLRFVLIKDLQPIQIIREKNKIVDSLYRPSLTPPISLELELEVWREVLDATVASLKQYPTTLEHDLELLQKPSIPFNTRNCLVLRSGEKQIFRCYEHLCEQIIRVLTLPPSDILEARANLSASGQRFFDEHIRRLLPKP